MSNLRASRLDFDRLCCWGAAFVIVAVGGVLAPVVGEVRADEDVKPSSKVERIRLIGVSRIDELPPIPPGVKMNFESQPTGIPIPIYEVISDEEIARGGRTDAGAFPAVVYRNSHDTGYGNYNKATEGNFVGNLLHLGNGFPVDGGFISGYDLLVHNSVSSPGGEATARVSLWDGDPLGLIDTRINDPPQEIPGTACTFSELVMAGTGSNGCVGGLCDGGFLDGEECYSYLDCGLCSALPGDDIPECPGLFRLTCTFAEKTMLPSRNVWMILEWLEGCRMGWRWALYDGPEVAAIGEENFCDNTCANTGVPCVDMAIEYVDAASQWGAEGIGTCCEDPERACNHADTDPENNCGGPRSCSDGVAESFDAWCYGAPAYFASFVASIYSPTDTTIGLIPVDSSDEAAIYSGNEIWITEGNTVLLELQLAGWDADGTGTQLKVWHAHIDLDSFANGIGGNVVPHTPPCAVDADCPHAEMGSVCVDGPDGVTGNPCSGGVCSCTAGFQNCGANAPPDNACLDMPAVNTEYYGYGSLAFNNSLADPGVPAYGGSLALDVPGTAKGTFVVAFHPSADWFMWDQDNQPIPLVGLIPAKISLGCRGFGQPQPEPNAVAKSRYLSFTPGGDCVQTAQRVTFESLAPPNDVLNGVTMWVGSPYQLSEMGGSMTATPLPAFWTAHLRCEPYFTDWGAYGTVHVTSRGIVPESVYSVQAVRDECPLDDESCYSSGLEIVMSRWGDVVGTCSPTGCTPPDGVIDFNDITAMVDKYRTLPFAISKTRADFHGEMPDKRVGFLDIAFTIHMFQGGEYPFYVPDFGNCSP